MELLEETLTKKAKSASLEFIIKAIIKVGKTERLELGSGEWVKIEGIKKGYFKDEHIKIEIRKSIIDPNATVLISADINGKVESYNILKFDLYRIFESIGMLDRKLDDKLNVLFYNKEVIGYDEKGHRVLKDAPKKYSANNSLTQGHRMLDSNTRAGDRIILSYYTHIHFSFPELINKVYIEIINNEEIIFSTKTGFDDPVFKLFYRNSIMLKGNVDNCKACELIRIVLMDEIKHQHMAFNIDELKEG